MRAQHYNVSQTPESIKSLAITQFKTDFRLFTHPYQQSHPPSSKCMEITIKKRNWYVYIWALILCTGWAKALTFAATAITS